MYAVDCCHASPPPAYSGIFTEIWIIYRFHHAISRCDGRFRRRRAAPVGKKKLNFFGVDA
jgi:hypothetical protein